MCMQIHTYYINKRDRSYKCIHQYIIDSQYDKINSKKHQATSIIYSCIKYLLLYVE